MQIPRVGGLREMPSPSPSPRLDVLPAATGGSARLFAEAAGAAQDVGGRAIQQAGVREHARLQAVNEANQIASAEFAAKLSAEEIRRRTELAGIGGKEASKASVETMKGFDQFYQEQSKTIVDPDLKARVRGHYLQYKNSLYGFAEGHAAQETRKWDNTVNQALVENETTAAINAWNDPERVELAAARVFGSIESLAARNGIPDEEAKAQEHAALSALNTGVLNRMLAAGQTDKAKEFYAKHPGGFKESASIERALQEQSTLGEIQKAVDEVMKGVPSTIGGGVAGGKAVAPSESLSDALTRIDKAAEGKDPKWREEARKILKERWHDAEVADEQAQESLYESMTKKYDSDPSQDPRNIDPVGWQRLPTKYRDALLKRYAKEQTNDGVFLDFMSKPLDEVAAYSKGKFEADVWSKLPDKQRNEARTRWTQAIDAGNKPEKRTAFNGIIGTEEQVKRSLLAIKDLGFKPEDTPMELAKGTSADKKKLDLWNQFRTDVNTAMELWTRTKNKNPDDKETQDIIDRLLLKKVFYEGTERPYVLVPEADRAKATIPIDKISAPEQEYIRNLLKSKGKKIDDEKIQRIYMAFQLNDKPLAMRILDE